MKHMKSIVVILCLIITLSLAAETFADATLMLERDTLTNIDDAAGRWQHSGGRVYMDRVLIGYYALHRRVTLMGTTPQNTAMLTLTIFFLRPNETSETAGPPENLTIQGSHDFTSGGYIGSISSASSTYSWLIGAQIKGSTESDILKIAF